MTRSGRNWPSAWASLVLQELRAREALLPPRLLGNPTVLTILIAQFLVSATLLSTAMLLPVFLQLVVCYSAAVSGAFMVPLILAQMASSITTGHRMRRTGRYKRSPQIGFLLLIIAFLLYATMSATTPPWLIISYFSLHGIALGLAMAPMTTAGQNAADFRDLGAFTGTSGFFRSLGGSFGTALLWTVLVLAFGHALLGNDFGFGPEVLRGGPAALAGLPEATRNAVLPSLTFAFATAFVLAAVIAGLGLIAVSCLKEIPLRTTLAAAPKSAESAE